MGVYMSNPKVRDSKRASGIACLLAACFLGGCSVSGAQSADACPAAVGVALQVLGSGGPIADDGRASSSYIVWVDGKSRILIDAGGGSFLRFAEAGGDFAALDFIGISHFHADHSADFPALLKSGNFAGRKRNLPVAGPDAGGPFPGLIQFVNALLNSKTGAFAYLSGYIDGTDDLPMLKLHEVSDSSNSPQVVYESEPDQISVLATHVPHGIVTALGFRVRVRGLDLVFASDQNGSDPDFVEFAKDSDILVMHMPIPEGITGGARQLHAPPSVIGEIASTAKATTLLISHFMARSLRNLDENLAAVRTSYDGRVLTARDLHCIAVR